MWLNVDCLDTVRRGNMFLVGTGDYAHVRPFSPDIIHTLVMQEAERGRRGGRLPKLS
jgi:hypothetical protein